MLTFPNPKLSNPSQNQPIHHSPLDQQFASGPMAPTAPTPSPEHVVLEFEVQRLRDELRSYEQELPCWTAEVPFCGSISR